MTTLKEFADAQVGELIDRFSAEVGNVCTNSDAEAIHDLRVSIRRLSQSLRALGGIYDKKRARNVRDRLKELMDLAGEVRSRDIAMELFEKAGIEQTAAPCVRLLMERDDLVRQLIDIAIRWRDSIGVECRQELELV